MERNSKMKSYVTDVTKRLTERKTKNKKTDKQ